jgi:channel protein (hemolysin III family)
VIDSFGPLAGRRNEFSLAGAIVFAAAMVTLYLTSTIYHALPRGRIKRLFRLFDHSAIFLLIAAPIHPSHWEPYAEYGLGRSLAFSGVLLSLA